MRILILILLVYLGYRVLKAIVMSGTTGHPPQDRESLRMVDDVMVKDPLCDTYFPKKDGIKTVIQGETLYFCSEKCRDEYLEKMRGVS